MDIQGLNRKQKLALLTTLLALAGLSFVDLPGLFPPSPPDDPVFRPYADTGLTFTSPANQTIIWDRTPPLTFNLSTDEEVLLYLDELAMQNLTTINNYSSDLSLLDAGNHSLSLYFNGSHHNVTFSINSYEKIRPDDSSCFTIQLNASTVSDSSRYLQLPCSSEVTAGNFSIGGSQGTSTESLASAVASIQKDYGVGYAHGYLGNQGPPYNNSNWHMLIVNATSTPTHPSWNITSVRWCGYISNMNTTSAPCTGGYHNYSVFEVTEYFYRNNTLSPLPDYTSILNWTIRNTTSSTWSTEGGSHNATSFYTMSVNATGDVGTEVCINLSLDQFNGMLNGSVHGFIIYEEPETYETGCHINFNTYPHFEVNYLTSYPQNVTIGFAKTNVYSHSDELNSTEYFVNTSIIQGNLSLNTAGNCTVEINITGTYGNLTFCSINSTFLRWHDPMVNLSDAIPYFYFFPTHRSSKNVSAWKQNSSFGVLNVSTNWSSNCELELKLNESLANVTLRVSNSSSIGGTINVSSTYQLIKHNVSSAELLWFWCDYFNPASLPKTYEVWFRCYDRD